jgi:type I restriction enzyme S subunit
MSDWQECKLVDIAEKFAMGPFGSNIKAENFVDFGVPVIRGTNFNFDKFVGGDFVFLTDEKADQLKSSNCFPGDLVFTHRGTIGQVGLIPEGHFQRYVISQSGMKLSVKKDILDKDFLFYFFKSSVGKHELLQHEAQVGVPSISNPLTSLKSVNILLPPLPEQRAIAAVLSSLDDKIDLLHRQNKTLEALAETLWRKMFIEDANPNWKKGKLGDLIELCYGKALKAGSRKPGEYPVLGSNGIVGYHNEFLVKGPGIVIGRKGTLGIVNYIAQNFFPIDTTFYVKSKTNSGKLYYEYFLLKTFALEDLNSDSAVPGLNRENAHAMEVIVPTLYAVIKYNTISEPLFSKQLHNSLQIHSLSTLRDGLLPKLMSGDVKVTK